MRLALAAALGLFLATSVAAGERWKGVVELPGGQELAFSVTFTEAGATIDIPAQGASGLSLANVVNDGRKLGFDIAQAGAAFVLTRSEDGRTAEGVLEQFGGEFPATMQRVADDATAELDEAEAGPNRPQTPKPPFPYRQWEARFQNGDVELAGTLTLPPGDGPHPAVVLVSGSGPQDRDEALFGHRPFAVIADHLTRRGIAVLRYDDRGVGGSTGSVRTSTTKDFAGDALAAIGFLEGLESIDGSRIGVLGHSEGGIVAPLVAARRPKTAFIVMLAGTGVPGKDVLREQMAALMRAAGAPAEAIEPQVAAQQELLGLIASDAPEAEVRAAVRGLVLAELAAAGAEIPEQQVDVAVSAEMAKVDSPWFRAFLTHDPREALRKVRCPVLAINGSLDTQVVPSQNLPQIERALGSSRDVTIRELPGLNHLFQRATTGGFAEYAQIEETISPEVLDLVATWIRQRAGLGAAG